MTIYNQSNDVPVMGIQVKTFPDGIKEAFDLLMQRFGAKCDYYGVSWMDEADDIIYYAMAREMSAAEGRQHNYERFTIEKGDYKTEAVHNWQTKTDRIKDVFHDLMKDKKPTRHFPCIEWYQSDEKMLCMVRVDS